MGAFRLDSPVATACVASPNHGERRNGMSPGMLLLHYTGMPTAEEALARLCAPDSEVSAHYLVFEDGRTVQLVPEARRAWHAGAAWWAGETDINSTSIGIEIANPGHEHGYRDFPRAQIEAVIALCRDIVARHGIRADRVLAHSDVAPMRKEDPGEKFPWRALHAAGVGHWVEPAPLAALGQTLVEGIRGAEVRDLQADLRRYGYGIKPTGAYDECTAAVVRAFQRHFRPARVDGLADASTSATLRQILVDRS
jgi:N-acetylmuramoyl-L-alanine amidase